MKRYDHENYNHAIKLLSSIEIDEWVVKKLNSLPEISDILEEIIGNSGNLDPYLVQNAIYVIGYIGNSRNLAVLSKILNAKDGSLRLCAMHAIKALNPDESARKQLKEFVTRKDIDDVEKIHAYLALGERPTAFSDNFSL